MTAAVALEDITVVHGATRVLDGVSLSVAPGEILVLSGPSGAGKTTLLRVLAGLAAPVSGVVKLAGRVATRGPRLDLPPEARGVAMVFQDLALWPHLSVSGNLAFALDARGAAPHARDIRISEALSQVGLAGHAHRYPGDLSGGERQRLAVARALVQDPLVVLFDEPLANLDVVRKHDLLSLFKQLLRRGPATAIYVTHDPGEAALLADRIAILEDGRLVQVGTMADLLSDPSTPFVQAFASARIPVAPARGKIANGLETL